MDIATIIIGIIVFLIAWVIVSIPLYIAAKVLTHGRATLGAAMLGTLFGVIVFGIVYWLTAVLFDAATHTTYGTLAGVILGFLAFLGLYKGLFKVGWLGALGIAILAIIVTVIIVFIIGAILVAIGIAFLT